MKEYKFKVGDKVKLGGDWAEHNQYAPGKHYPVGRLATVVGYPRNYPYECTRIVFEGHVTPQSFHNTFLEPASEYTSIARPQYVNTVENELIDKIDRERA